MYIHTNRLASLKNPISKLNSTSKKNHPLHNIINYSLVLNVDIYIYIHIQTYVLLYLCLNFIRRYEAL